MEMKLFLFVMLASFVSLGVSGSCYDCCVYSNCPAGWTCCGCDNECYCCDNYEFCHGSIPNIKCSPIKSGGNGVVVPSWLESLVTSKARTSSENVVAVEKNSTLRGGVGSIVVGDADLEQEE